MTRRRPRLQATRRAAALAVASLVAVPAAAQLFVDAVDVNLVNVEVIVTRDDRPVTGLGRDDFEVTDDKTPVEIANFYSVEEGQRLAADAAAPPSLAAADEPFAVIVLVDNAFVSPASRRKVLSRLHARLDDLMAGGTQVMVVAKEREVDVLQRFTADRAEVEAALQAIEKTAGSANLDAASALFVLREIERAGRTAEDARQTLDRARAYAADAYDDVRRSARVLRGFVGSMTGLPGRKALLYLSDRLPLSPGEEVFAAWWARFGPAFGGDLGVVSARDLALEYDATSEVYQLIADANTGRVAFYPVGSDVSPVLSARAARGRGFAPVSGPPPEHAGLRYLARFTGGDAALGHANADALVDRLRQDATHFYSLGYPSPHGGDGAIHRVKVKVKRPGVEVRYLETYRDKSRDQQMNDRTLASLFFDEAQNPLGVALEIGEMKRQDGHFLVPLAVKFPVASLALLPQEDAWAGNVSIFIVTRDQRGQTSKPAKIPLPLSIPNERMPEARGQVAAYATRLAMRPGEQTIAVGLFDDLAAKSSTVHLTVQVGEPERDKKSRKRHE